MYGIILDSMMDCIKQVYGEKIWQNIVGSRDLTATVFTTHRIYDEQLVATISKLASELTGVSVDAIMEAAGEHFIVYINEIRNDSITKVLGRTFKDFLNGLNCMHEYYRFSFTEMQPPSFLVSKEDDEGIELQYRSRRTFSGLIYYVKGLLTKIALKFYSINLDVEIRQHGFASDVMLAIYRLNYPNNEYRIFRELLSKKRDFHINNNLTLDSNDLFDLFPFHLAFDNKLEILSTGLGLEAIQNGLEGRRLNETFFMTRPLGYELTWNNILINRNNVFELTSAKSSVRHMKRNDTSRFRDQMTATHFIKLRGRMLFVEEGDYVLFVATLMIDDLNNMYDMGIFVNDLPLHDLSRDMALRGPQNTTEYKLALNLEQGKAARLEEMVQNLSFEQRKSDDLRYCMIPREIANDLRQGVSGEKLCKVYEDVTVLFSDVVNFDNICQHIAPHEVMIILNMMVNVFDILCDQFTTYKVETVADGFMCVSGAPNYNRRHAHNMADMAIEMLRGILSVRDPNTRKPIQIRIGLHCGSVVTGLIGHKVPQFCLFGDTVNIASKMEATGFEQRIQISQTCCDKLMESDEYYIEEKGIVNIKGNHKIMTYWLNGKKKNSDDDLSPNNLKSSVTEKKSDEDVKTTGDASKDDCEDEEFDKISESSVVVESFKNDEELYGLESEGSTE